MYNIGFYLIFMGLMFAATTPFMLLFAIIALLSQPSAPKLTLAQIDGMLEGVSDAAGLKDVTAKFLKYFTKGNSDAWKNTLKAIYANPNNTDDTKAALKSKILAKNPAQKEDLEKLLDDGAG